ncbi:Uma2 family endonuclease [Anatilimnocola sp. NA78]|uniref:Uma2 family endonuclease n=1 Tax=Anatilimnocola sp. NA78 TaxID=3415683 RepID=UPI003CE4A1D2
MTLIVLDQSVKKRIITDRRARGHDRFDEVWDGVYVIAPSRDNEHQQTAGRLATIVDLLVAMNYGGRLFAGCNVSDRNEDWLQNFRCPDVALYLPGTPAIDRYTHWQGGPDFAVEIVSRNDRSWQKLEFYAKVGTRELLIVDRDPWQLTLLQLQGDQLVISGASSAADGNELASNVVPLGFRLTSPEGLPTIEVRHLTDGRKYFAPASPR